MRAASARRGLGGASTWVGRAGRRLVKKVFAAWQGFQDGQDTRAQLQAKLAPLMHRLNRLLLEGAILGEDRAVATFCDNVLAYHDQVPSESSPSPLPPDFTPEKLEEEEDSSTVQRHGRSATSPWKGIVNPSISTERRRFGNSSCQPPS